jgi:hypothetical protein
MIGDALRGAIALLGDVDALDVAIPLDEVMDEASIASYDLADATNDFEEAESFLDADAAWIRMLL